MDEVDKFSQFSPEDTAFIYQQIEDLKGFLSAEALITVEEVPRKSIKNKVTSRMLKIIISEGEDVILALKVKGPSIAEAMMTGKKQIFKVLSDMTDESISSAQRQAEINDLMKNTTRH